MDTKEIKIGTGGQWVQEMWFYGDLEIEEAWTIEQKLEMLRKIINNLNPSKD